MVLGQITTDLGEFLLGGGGCQNAPAFPSEKVARYLQA